MSRPLATEDHRAADDETLLRALHMRDIEGLTRREIAQRLGRGRNSWASILHRIDSATEPSEHDGTLSPAWWREGLRRREREARMRINHRETCIEVVMRGLRDGLGVEDVAVSTGHRVDWVRRCVATMRADGTLAGLYAGRVA
jgi:hypothetical protein